MERPLKKRTGINSVISKRQFGSVAVLRASVLLKDSIVPIRDRGLSNINKELVALIYINILL